MKLARTLLVSSLVSISTTSNGFVLNRSQITSADIVSGMTLDPSCLNYCITGICVWLRCTLVGCSVETSIKVSHYNPDVVVSVYDEGGGNPWVEAQSLYGAIELSLAQSLTATFHGSFAGGGQQTEGGNSAADNSLRFKEATIVGHPLSSISQYAGNGYYCPSEADSFAPYFSSSFDTLTWRLGLPEYLYVHNLIPGRRIVGDGIHQQWGPVWPRTGFIKQKDDAKAAAVIAQRAANIVTQARQPHVYQQLDGNGYYKSWLPGELRENDEATGVWQMLSPRMDRQCYAFGENDVYRRSWSVGRNSEDNKYTFALWRPYECCESQGLYLLTVPLRVCL